MIYYITSMILLVLYNISNNKIKRTKIKTVSITQLMDKIANTKLAKEILIDESNKKQYAKLKKLVSTADIPKLTIPRLQIACILSSIVVALGYVGIYLLKLLNYKLMYPRLLELSKMLINEQLAKAPTVNWIDPIIFGLLAYSLPILAIKVYAKMKENKAMSEVLMLQTFVMMRLSTNKNVYYILEMLYERSKIYKEPLRRACNYYHTDINECFNILRKSISSDEFNTIINSLEKALSDKAMARDYIERRRRLEKVNRKTRKMNENKKKQIIGTFILFLPLLTMLAIVGYPWFVYNMKLLAAVN